MKIGVLFPTTWTLIEKYGALFPEGFEVVGQEDDNHEHWNKYYPLKTREWKELGLPITLNLRPFKEIRFSDYDILIESVETFYYSRDWKKYCNKIECPVVLKACWTKKPSSVMPWGYTRKMKKYPVLLEMPAHASQWKSAGFQDVNVIFNPVGDWWFSQNWNGRADRLLFVLAGAKVWRSDDPTQSGLDIWKKMRQDFPSQAYHHDGHETYKSPLEMAKFFAESRVLVNLDRPFGQGERTMTIVFTEALSAGMPVVARDLPGLNYKDFIDSNGVCSNDYQVMTTFIRKCLTDYDFAKKCSERSREIGLANFSVKALRPKYDQIFERASEAYNK